MSSASSERSLTPSETDDTLSSSSAGKSLPAQELPRSSWTPGGLHTLFILVITRCINATSILTFFQPDEFFQSLEPAWRIAFGEESGAWITWEWRHQLRSSIHPYLFAGVYSLTDLILGALRVTPEVRANVLVLAPKLTQGVFAALGDYFTWTLASRVYGAGSSEAYAALILTFFSPWQYFCSGRTFSNSLETTLTVIALYLWPWQWTASGDPHNRRRDNHRKPISQDDLLRLRVCLLLAAVACILRPTNLMVWLCLVSFVIFANPPWNWQTTANVYVPLIRETILCGSVVLFTSILADRVFFGSWTLPPVKFLYFNLAQSLAVFYGKNDWHYYLTQGYPLLLTTFLPFALVGLYQSLFQRPPGSSICRQLAFVCVFMPAVLSLISHKEVRFIYPLLPSLHVLAAPSFVRFFRPALSPSSAAGTPRRLTLIFLFVVNLSVAMYICCWHAVGPTNVLRYLREEHNLLLAQTTGTVSVLPDNTSPQGMTIGFLMPCHSTPWRSHIVHPTIHAWALTCEPPVNLNATEKEAYVDEADEFYNDPSAFLRDHMVGGTRGIPTKPSYQTTTTDTRLNQDSPPPDQHNWPDYLVFFAQLEPLLNSELRPSAYAECYRSWNTAWHDDWRRKGDIIVWCLDGDSQSDWRQRQQRNQWQSILGFEDGSWERKREKLVENIVERLRKQAAAETGKLEPGVGMGNSDGVWDRVSLLLRKLKWQRELTPLSRLFPDAQMVKLRIMLWRAWFADLPYLRQRGPVVESEKQPWWRDWMGLVTKLWHRHVGGGDAEL